MGMLTQHLVCGLLGDQLCRHISKSPFLCSSPSLLVLIKLNGLCLYSIRKDGRKEGRNEGKKEGRKERKHSERQKIYERTSQGQLIMFELFGKVSLRW